MMKERVEDYEKKGRDTYNRRGTLHNGQKVFLLADPEGTMIT